MYVCMYVRMYICMYVCMYVCTYVCMYACMYVCMHVCVCTLYRKYIRISHQSYSHVLNVNLRGSWYRNIVFLKWSLGVVNVALLCFQSDPQSIPHTTEEKGNIESNVTVCCAAETAEQKNTDWVSPGQKVDQDVLLVQLPRSSHVPTPK